MRGEPVYTKMISRQAYAILLNDVTWGTAHLHNAQLHLRRTIYMTATCFERLRLWKTQKGYT